MNWDELTQVIGDNTKTVKELKIVSNAVEKFCSGKFTQGYICAVANMLRMEGECGIRTRELFQSGGNYTINQLKKLGVDESDLEILLQYWDELNHK